MTCIDTTMVKPEPHSLAHRLHDAVGRAWHAHWRRRGQRATVLMLGSLDDHALKDIGIGRSEIDSVVYGRPGERRQHYDRNWE